MGRMIVGGCGMATHEPSCTLEACLYVDAVQGGTIHQFRPRLTLRKEYCRTTGAKTWLLCLDGYEIGHCPRSDNDGVTVDTFDGVQGRRFNWLFPNPDYVYLASGRKAYITTEFRDGWLIVTSISEFRIDEKAEVV